jgi:serine/threonine-protein kinase
LRATEAGLILGTAGYMSPEQAAGKSVDRRADIWAFGVVLYELLTGKRLFDGETVTHTLADVVRAPIDLEGVPLKELIGRCLDRNVKSRLRDIGEARIAIERYSPDARPSEPRPSGSGRAWLGWAVAGIATLVAALGWYTATRPAPPRPLIRVEIQVPPATPLARTDGGSGVGGNPLALSSDGTRLALTLRSPDGKVRLHTRLLHQTQFTPLPGTENAHGPFFSPEGDWIGFFADGKLKKIAVDGGAAVTLCDALRGYGGSWGDDGNIVVALDFRTTLSRIPSAGGTPTPLTKLNATEETHRWPQVLPGSQTVLFTAAAQTLAGYDDASIEALSLKTGERRTVHRGGFFPRYLSDAARSGHLLYLHQSTAFAAPFDPEKLALTGAPVPILEDAGSTLAAGGDFAFARNGTFVYLPGAAAQAGWPISSVVRSGKPVQPWHAQLGQYFNPRFSPDGKRLAFSLLSGKGQDIWVKDLDRDTPSRLSFLPGANTYPVWTPDSRTIVFRSANPAAPGLYAIRADGSGEAKRLTDGKANEYPSSFSPDGKRLAIFQSSNGDNFDLFTVPAEADAAPGGAGIRLGKPEPFLATPFIETNPAFSPDGRWLAYHSNESGTAEVYVRPFPGPGGRRQVSTGGGFAPEWSRDGRELIYISLDRRVMAATYTAKGDSFTPGTLQVWAEARIRTGALGRPYDLTPDGKRLAAILAGDDEKLPTHLTVLLNFFDELRRRAPGN